MTINYVPAARAAFADSKSITYTTFKAHCTGDNCTDKELRAAFTAYRNRAAALIETIADAHANITNGIPMDAKAAAAIITAAKNYLSVFAATKKDNTALLFNVETGETNEQAAARIVAALAPIAKNGTAKSFDGTRRGAINLNADSKATATVMAALETWALDRVDGVTARNAAAMIDDKKQRKAAAAAKRAAQKAATEKENETAKQPAPVKAAA